METELFPIVRGEQPFATSVAGIDDEAADESDDMVIPPPVIEDLVPTPETSRRNMPPPPSAVVSAPASVLPAVPMDAQGGVANAGDAAMAPAPNIEQGGGLQYPVWVSRGPVTLEITETTDAVEALEPDAKRPRLLAIRVGAETVVHVREMSENDLWQPFSSLEPMLDAATMEKEQTRLRLTGFWRWV